MSKVIVFDFNNHSDLIYEIANEFQLSIRLDIYNIENKNLDEIKDTYSYFIFEGGNKFLSAHIKGNKIDFYISNKFENIVLADKEYRNIIEAYIYKEQSSLTQLGFKPEPRRDIVIKDIKQWLTPITIKDGIKIVNSTLQAKNIEERKPNNKPLFIEKNILDILKRNNDYGFGFINDESKYLKFYQEIGWTENPKDASFYSIEDWYKLYNCSSLKEKLNIAGNGLIIKGLNTPYFNENDFWYIVCYKNSYPKKKYYAHSLNNILLIDNIDVNKLDYDIYLSSEEAKHLVDALSILFKSYLNCDDYTFAAINNYTRTKYTYYKNLKEDDLIYEKDSSEPTPYYKDDNNRDYFSIEEKFYYEEELNNLTYEKLDLEEKNLELTQQLNFYKLFSELYSTKKKLNYNEIIDDCIDKNIDIIHVNNVSDIAELIDNEYRVEIKSYIGKDGFEHSKWWEYKDPDLSRYYLENYSVGKYIKEDETLFNFLISNYNFIKKIGIINIAIIGGGNFTELKSLSKVLKEHDIFANVYIIDCNIWPNNYFIIDDQIINSPRIDNINNLYVIKKDFFEVLNTKIVDLFDLVYFSRVVNYTELINYTSMSSKDYLDEVTNIISKLTDDKVVALAQVFGQETTENFNDEFKNRLRLINKKEINMQELSIKNNNNRNTELIIIAKEK